MQCPIKKPHRRLPVPWKYKKWENDENFQKPENANLFKKIAKICDIQKLKPIPLQLKIFQ